MTERGLKQLSDLLEKARTGDEKPWSKSSNGVEYLCDSDACSGRVVHVVLGHSAGEHEQWLQCQSCKRLFGYPWIERQWESGLMPDVPAALRPWPQRQEWLFEVVKQARNGNEEAKNALCEILENELKRWIESRLKVRSQDRQDAHQEVILRVRRKIEQLREPGKFFAWLLRVVKDVAKRQRPPCLSRCKPEQEERPKQIGTKTILIDGQQHVVRIFEPSIQQEQARQPLLEPLSDSIITNWSKDNRPTYPRSIDFRRALSKLPERWALAISLVFTEGYSRTEAAEIMGCSKKVVYRLHKKARKRLQLLLPGYTLGHKARSQPRFGSANLAHGPVVEKLASQDDGETSGNPDGDGVDQESWEALLVRQARELPSTEYSLPQRPPGDVAAPTLDAAAARSRATVSCVPRSRIRERICPAVIVQPQRSVRRSS